MSTNIRLISNFTKIVRELEKSLPKQCLRACHVVRNEWIDLLGGTRSGRTYRVPGTTRFYTASAAGEPPAPRMGTAGIRGSIRVMPYMSVNRIAARVGSWMEHFVYLQYGTRTMDPRPSLDVALRQAKPKIEAIFREGLI